MTESAGLAETDELGDLDELSRNLDYRWRIPVTRIRFGLDALAGLIPGVGYVAAALVSGHIILHGWRGGVPRRVLASMNGNLALEQHPGR